MAGALDGRVALVTGGGGEIGAAIAASFVDAGARVVVADENGERAAAVARSLGDAGAAATVDVRDHAQVQALVDDVLERHGRLDVAVANAGVSGPVSSLVELPVEAWRTVTAVNLDGVYFTFRAAGAAMAAAGDGVLLSTASIMGLRPAPLCGAYSATKAAIINLTRAFALELRPAGVRANAICPGFVDTRLVRDAEPELCAALGVPDLDAIVSAAQGRWVQPEDVARLAVFLATDRAAFMTGAAYPLDGGLSSNLM